MTKPLSQEAGRISADTLAIAAAQGVERALAARATMTELTSEQTQQVSGALVASPVVGSVKLRPPIIYGLWYPIDPKTLGAETLNTQQF
jgi:hypothetical protein